MLPKIEKNFNIVFLIIVFLELLTASLEYLKTVHYFVKPAIVISLILLFVRTYKSIPKPTKTLILSALVCSLIGDICLMFVAQSEHFFTLGLIAFLTAHVMYILVFLKHRNTKKFPFGFTGLLLIYAISLFYLLKGGLGDMLIPVIIYILIILCMVTTAFWRRKNVNHLSFILVFLGALFFMLSDSILAINKFYKPLPISNIIIMITYALAQYFIVIGILKHKTSVGIKE